MLLSTFTGTKTGYFSSVVLVALILIGCSGEAPYIESNIQDTGRASSYYYLRELQQSNDENKADWQLLAIGALLREGKISRAAEQLNTLPRGLNEAQYREQQLLEAELQLARENYPAVNYILARLKPESLSVNQQVRYYQAKTKANKDESTLGLVRAYIAQEPLLLSNLHQQNIDKTWQALVQLTPQNLKNLAINVDEYTLRGWLDLLYVWQNNRQNPLLLQAAIKDWQTSYPKNPAAKTLPTQLHQVSSLTQTSAIKIALLLPLSGSASVFGDAIQQGFIAASDGVQSVATSLQTGEENATDVDSDSNPDAELSANETSSVVEPGITPGMTPMIPASNHVEIKTYDTSTQSISALLAQAQRDGATLIVGPLLKPNVEQLSRIPTSLNILALNQPGIDKDDPHICYFALSPEDEARDTARHLWQQHKQMPLLLIPRGAFGDRVARAFTEEWRNQGGLTVLQQRFGSSMELRQRINSGTGIRMTGNPVKITPGVEPLSTGGHVDAVYIVATLDELTLIKPMIDMATNSWSKPALFASSRSYQAGAGPDYRLEMEGIQFSDIPLLAGANPALMQQAMVKFGNDYSLVRLYAMGIDAWTLANHFIEIKQLSDFKIAGFTGILSVAPNCIIQRQLPWLRYHKGAIVPVTTH